MDRPPQDDRLARRVASQRRALLGVTRALADPAGFGVLGRCVVDALAQVYTPAVARLVIRAPGHMPAVYGLGGHTDEAIAAADTTLVERVASSGPVEILPHDDLVESGLWAGLPGPLSVVRAVPIAVEQVTGGVLWAGFEAPPEWDELDWQFIEILAGQVGVAYAQRLRELRHEPAWWLPVVVDRIPDPVIVLDSEHIVRLCNEAAAALFGNGTPTTLTGKPLRDLAGLADLAEEISAAGGEPENGQASEVTSRDGLAFAPHVSVVRAENGAIEGWVLVLRDISHFKRINASMSDFLGTVSHDLRSPLTFMRGYLDMLGMVGDLNDRQAGFAGKISDGITQMADIVEKVLEAGKLDPVTGDYQLIRETTDLTEMVRQIAGDFAEAAAKKHLDLRWAAADDLPVVEVDRAMLRSAFTNLVENAVKYTPDEGRVEIELKRNGSQVVFRVSDNGYGIRPEDQAHLFDRHVRVHRKEWKRVKGSGLGLFIVRSVARRHGGDAWVESEIDVGSSFFVAIPLESANLPGASGG